MKSKHLIFISRKEEQEEQEESRTGVCICENTDGILDPLEQMLYALNETQVRYGPVVVLKNAP
ncbi:MAG: hypothetical protein WBZ36_02115 [Candidatus Nitrosopolaris sp.]